MKTFFIIIGAIVIISFGIVFYLYQNVTFQPEYIEKQQEIYRPEEKEKANETFKRIRNELKRNNSSVLTANDLRSVMIYEIMKVNDKSASKAIKKINCQIEDNRVKIEAVVDIEKLADLNVSNYSKSIAGIIKSFMLGRKNVGEVYVSIECEPYNENGNLKFNEDPVIQIGGFDSAVSLISSEIEEKMDKISIDGFDISNFEMKGNKVKIFK